MRFQKAADGTYFGLMEPIYNVMPMAVAHFVDRFADQKFILYDKRRGFGYYYDGTRATEITLDGAMPHIVGGKIDETLMAEDELLFQKMWQTYFKAIAIKERANPRKQRQDMPMRFWKYLTEKQSII
jgi:probable DNA metabolism protein